MWSCIDDIGDEPHAKSLILIGRPSLNSVCGLRWMGMGVGGRVRRCMESGFGAGQGNSVE